MSSGRIHPDLQPSTPKRRMLLILGNQAERNRPGHRDLGVDVLHRSREVRFTDAKGGCRESAT
jgi:hypothetical protein